METPPENDITDTVANLPAGATELRIGSELNGSDSGDVVRIYPPEQLAPNQSSAVKGVTNYTVLELVTTLKEEIRKCEGRIQAQATNLLSAHTLFTKVDSMETEIEKLQKGLDVLQNEHANLRLQIKMQEKVLLHFMPASQKTHGPLSPRDRRKGSRMPREGTRSFYLGWTVLRPIPRSTQQRKREHL
ncbi:hypothetical protein NA56DRAFT_197774 [Hyaloscypha hepaticicola]|uniref:Uncharacterized protein n=1 Tax=Hyaloscypha hepaticicola TaxID=2082293 RepID=A0A2J6Q093_9HELO|nr:hypothetical protein NA56DRAFT_197774 [Hyaloscypha hepaticicola]